MAEPGALYKHSFVTREANEGRGGMVGLQGLVWWGIKSSIPHCGDHVYYTNHTVVTMYTTHTTVW